MKKFARKGAFVVVALIAAVGISTVPTAPAQADSAWPWSMRD